MKDIPSSSLGLACGWWACIAHSSFPISSVIGHVARPVKFLWFSFLVCGAEQLHVSIECFLTCRGGQKQHWTPGSCWYWWSLPKAISFTLHWEFNIDRISICLGYDRLFVSSYGVPIFPDQLWLRWCLVRFDTLDVSGCRREAQSSHDYLNDLVSVFCNKCRTRF